MGRVVLPEYTKAVGRVSQRKTEEEHGLQISIHKFDMGDDATVHSIIFTVPQEVFIDPKEPKKEEKKEFIRNFQYRLVGPYLCYRNYTDDKIRIRKVLPEKG